MCSQSAILHFHITRKRIQSYSFPMRLGNFLISRDGCGQLVLHALSHGAYLFIQYMGTSVCIRGETVQSTICVFNCWSWTQASKPSPCIIAHALKSYNNNITRRPRQQQALTSHRGVLLLKHITCWDGETRPEQNKKQNDTQTTCSSRYGAAAPTAALVVDFRSSYHSLSVVSARLFLPGLNQEKGQHTRHIVFVRMRHFCCRRRRTPWSWCEKSRFRKSEKERKRSEGAQKKRRVAESNAFVCARARGVFIMRRLSLKWPANWRKHKHAYCTGNSP